MDAAGIDIVLRATADRLAAMNPYAAMSPGALHREVQLSVWDHHGLYNGAKVGRDITAVLSAVADLPLTGTRDQYAARLRTAASGMRVAELHRQADAEYTHAQDSMQKAAALGQLAAARQSAGSFRSRS